MPSTSEVGSGTPWYEFIVLSSASTALWMLITSCLTVCPVGRMSRGSDPAKAREGRIAKREKSIVTGSSCTDFEVHEAGIL